MKKETVAIDVGTKDKSEVHKARLILAIKPKTTQTLGTFYNS